MTVVDDAIAHYSVLPSHAFREWRGTVEDIDAAILFFLATWSGPCLFALLRLTTHLASDTRTRPHVLVFDIDGLSPHLRRECGPLQGVGETFWIRNGVVVARLANYDREDWSRTIDENCKLLE